MALVLSTRQEWTSTRSSDCTFPPNRERVPKRKQNHHDIQENLEIQDFMLKVHPKTTSNLSPKTFPFKVWNLDNKTNLEALVL
jgi:hypothetical protein